MLEAFFRGERHLFKGLAIERLLPEPWKTYPVIHLDFSGEDYSEASVLERKLDTSLKRLERENNIQISNETYSERLRTIIEYLHTANGQPVVVLIDEYDNPITSTIGHDALQERMREILYGFYSSLKTLDRHIHFCFLTGVTKYGQLSVFSGLNNLMDISLMNDFAGICGITDAELHENLACGVEELAGEENISVPEAFAMLKDWYDGYHFSKSLLDVYNPFSVMNALARRELSDYWYHTGAPSILIKTLQTNNISIANLSHSRASLDMLDNVSAIKVNPVALFYQTGYLTIKGYDSSSRIFTLGFPNKEVEVGLMDNVLSAYGHISDSKVMVSDLRRYLEEGNPEGFILLLKSFFANIPYDLRRNVEKYENYYHTIFYVIVRLLGMEVNAEYHTSEGSIDIVIKTSQFIYIVELKINGTAEDAIKQINSKGYAAQFLSESRKIFKIGIGFAEATHTVDSYIIE